MVKEKKNSPEYQIHIGNLISEKLKSSGHSTAWLAEMIHCKRANVYKIFGKSSIDTTLLLRISLALETDLFFYYSEIYRNIAKTNKSYQKTE